MGYPLLIVLLGRLFAVSWKTDPEYCPTVTILIAAYNEESVIAQKICNSLELRYPPDRMQVLIVSDGSTDNTNSIVAKYIGERVSILTLPQNSGKANAINQGMAQIKSEIVVLSDANVIYNQDAIQHLVSHFADHRVGAVSGKVVLYADGLSYAAAEGKYYDIEHSIQEQESRTGAVIGTDGGMYAIRRNLYSPLNNDTILDDFVISMRIARQGFLVLNDQRAIGLEENINEIGAEFRRKSRIIAGGIQCLLRREGLPRFSQGFLLIKFFSHKVLRWFCGPVALILISLLIVLFGRGEADHLHFVVLLFVLSITILAGVGQTYPLARRWRLIALPHYLAMLFLSSLVGCWLGLTGGQKVTWRSS